MRKDTLPLSHFEAIYSRGDDPWHFADSAYEQAKYQATIAALPRARYGRGFEVGCSIGVLTGMLAGRCDALLACEPVETALAAARVRNAALTHVGFSSFFVPGDWPDGRFDLVVLSEVLDYLGAEDIEALAARLEASLLPAGDVVLVHWVGKKRARPSGTEASDSLIAATAPFTTVLHQSRNESYRLDVLRRAA